MKIAFLGTGLMGNLMAERLIKNNFELTVWNRTKSKTGNLKSIGAIVAETPSNAIKHCDLIITMLSDYSAVQQVLSDNEISYLGKTLIQMGTIGPQESISIKNIIEAGGGEYLEAPVLGGLAQIPDGKLLPMVGSSKVQFDKWKSFLMVFGESVVYTGEVGKGAAVKLACNQLIASLLTSFSMSLGYITAQNIDPEIFMKIIRPSSYYVPAFDRKLENMISHDYSNTNFPLKHLLKDVKLAKTEFTNFGINTDVLRQIENVLIAGLNNHLGEKDYSALHEIITNAVQ